MYTRAERFFMYLFAGVGAVLGASAAVILITGLLRENPSGIWMLAVTLAMGFGAVRLVELFHRHVLKR